MTPINKIAKTLNRLTNALYNECDDILSGKLPQVVYHYTQANGFLGIINSGKIFLSNVLYLNDQSELAYGRNLVIDIIEKRIISTDDQIAKDILRASLAGFKSHEMFQFLKFYVACFCANGNLLSQWRSYGANNSGYALGFSSKDLSNKSIMLNERTRIDLHPVEYRRDKQESVITKAIDLCLSSGRKKKPGKNNETVGDSSLLIFLLISGFLTFFKHPVFSEENEWRLTCRTVGNETHPILNFRDQGGNIIPYLALDVTRATQNGKKLLPIESISIGPCVEPELRVHTLQELLTSKGYSSEKININRSDIPLRTV